MTPDLIHRRFRAVAAAQPDATAIVGETEELTYAELDARSDSVAAALRAAGVRAGDHVGVCLERTPDLVVALLAVLKANAAYVPLDLSYPANRLAFVAEDAGLAMVIADAPDRVPNATVHLWESLCAGPREQVAVEEINPDATAYVIYTSGSTGRPKGVVVPHQNVTALVDGTRAEFALSPEDTWSWFHSAAFDVSVYEIWGCLLTGGRLVVVSHWTCRTPHEFRALLRDKEVTILSQTPSAFANLLEVERKAGPDLSLRMVIFAGEPLDARMLTVWFDSYPESRCRMVNMFGITETTVHVTVHTVRRADALAGSRSVGVPIPGWLVRVVDTEGRPLPPGVAGEIEVGGAGLATGYLNRPELTAERFRHDPVSGERWYRSGDGGRLLADGQLEHLGRLDNQIKLRGYRIELGEIRAQLIAVPGVLAAAVVLREATPGDAASACLDAYVVLDQGLSTAAVPDIRRHVATELPDYMVPSTFTTLPALPLTVNGKLDPARLPEPNARSGAVAPAGESEGPEDIVRAAWQEVIGTSAGLDDNFYELGGNSLLAARVAAVLRSRGFPTLTVRAIYENQTVRRLTAYLRGDNTLRKAG